MPLKDALEHAIAGDPRHWPRIVASHPPAGTAGEPGQKGRAATPGARFADVPAEHEAELAAMHAVLAELRPLGGAARARVLKWVEEVLAPTPGTPEPIDEVDL